MSGIEERFRAYMDDAALRKWRQRSPLSPNVPYLGRLTPGAPVLMRQPDPSIWYPCNRGYLNILRKYGLV